MHPLTSLELDRVLTLAALEARSDIGKRLLVARRPFWSVDECESSQGLLAEMRSFYLRDGLLPFAGLADVAPRLGSEAPIELPDSWLILRAVRASQAVRETFVRSSESYPRLTEAASSIPDLRELAASVGRFFTKDGKIREDASAELRTIRTRIQTKRSAIQKTLTDLMSRHGTAMQEPLITIRGDRYCLPVRTDSRGSVPGILHERSGSGSTLFIEPLGAVEMNNDLAELLIREREELARIARFIAARLLENAESISAAAELTGELDALQASALLAETMEATRPRFSTGRELVLVEARHPLLDERLARLRAAAFGEAGEAGSVVPVSFSIDAERPVLVISGPNAGGKTVSLKTAGLVVAMAMSGLPVPAREGTVIPVVDRIEVLVGDDQDVLEHRSTFSSYLIRLRGILESATERSLVLLDELGSGTDPEEGAALAAATIEHLFMKESLVIATTHLSSVKNLASGDKRVENASMEFDSGSGRPTFRLVAGVPGRSRAIEIAEWVGLPAEVIRSAREKLGDRYLETDRLLADLQQKVRTLSASEQALRLSQERLDAERAVFDDEREGLRRERERLASSYREELVRLEDDVQRSIEAELRSLREADRREREQIRPSTIVEKIVRPLEGFAKLASLTPPKMGDRVEHRRLKMKGTLVAIQGKKGTIAAGGKRIEVELGDLLVLAEEAPAKSATRPRRETEGSGDDLEPKVAAELNLIGQHVEEALEESDRFLDRALLEGKGAVRLIHGFGTGALRKALREHLKRHPAVRSFRPGTDREGGDGATVAILDV